MLYPRSFTTISSGRCFFRRFVIESLLARTAVDLHTDWIRISKAGHEHAAAGEPTRAITRVGPQAYARTVTESENLPTPLRFRAATWNTKDWPGLNRLSMAAGIAEAGRLKVNHFDPGTSSLRRIT